MAAPFLRDPIDQGAILVRLAFYRERVLRDRQDPLSHHDDLLYERYRFCRQGIIYVQDLLEPYIANTTRRSRALTVSQNVCIALRFFASGKYLYSVGDAENIRKAAACRAVRKVYLALEKLMNVFITFPGHVRVNSIKEGFYGIAEFPNVIGAVDCTQIPIKSPSGPNEADFVNRKGVHSINVQMICDSTCLITHVVAKWPGSVHVSRIFRVYTVPQLRASPSSAIIESIPTSSITVWFAASTAKDKGRLQQIIRSAEKAVTCRPSQTCSTPGPAREQAGS